MFFNHTHNSSLFASAMLVFHVKMFKNENKQRAGGEDDRDSKTV